MTLKSAIGQPEGIYQSLQEDWSHTPADGTALVDFYAWEERRVDAMRRDMALPFYYIWVPATGISLSKREAARLDLDGFANEPLAIRRTGGTAVPQGPGTANITLFTRHPRMPSVRSFYEKMCAALVSGFSELGLHTTIGAKPGSFCDGEYNLLLNGQKLAGTAQRWCRARNGDTIGCHHVVVLTGGSPAEMCSRLEALYDYAEQAETYDPTAHNSHNIDVEILRVAMENPLRELVSF